jgi:hypothetical protein
LIFPGIALAISIAVLASRPKVSVEVSQVQGWGTRWFLTSIGWLVAVIMLFFAAMVESVTLLLTASTPTPGDSLYASYNLSLFIPSVLAFTLTAVSGVWILRRHQREVGFWDSRIRGIVGIGVAFSLAIPVLILLSYVF